MFHSRMIEERLEGEGWSSFAGNQPSCRVDRHEDYLMVLFDWGTIMVSGTASSTSSGVLTHHAEGILFAKLFGLICFLEFSGDFYRDCWPPAIIWDFPQFRQSSVKIST